MLCADHTGRLPQLRQQASSLVLLHQHHYSLLLLSWWLHQPTFSNKTTLHLRSHEWLHWDGQHHHHNTECSDGPVLCGAVTSTGHCYSNRKTAENVIQQVRCIYSKYYKDYILIISTNFSYYCRLIMFLNWRQLLVWFHQLVFPMLVVGGCHSTPPLTRRSIDQHCTPLPSPHTHSRQCQHSTSITNMSHNIAYM